MLPSQWQTTWMAGLTGVESLYIAPGSPWENGYAENFHSRLRDEQLSAEEFADVTDARALAASWRHEYNHQRPHSSLGYMPPAVFAARCGRPAQEEETPAADAPRCAASIAGGPRSPPRGGEPRDTGDALDQNFTPSQPTSPHVRAVVQESPH
ncbi:MAG: transposase [Phycisphaerales bacterium]|nr:transposase [Phycisphaerales bacterium]